MLKSDGDIIITQAKISDTFFSNVNINLIQEIEKLENINVYEMKRDISIDSKGEG